MDETFLYNHPQNKKLRRSLRKNSTEVEKRLKNKELSSLKSRRQYGIGRYIVDFYCPALRLAIELDGDSHLEKGTKEYGQQREDYIRSFDIHFLRFTNDQIYNDLDKVLERIEKAAKRFKKSPPKPALREAEWVEGLGRYEPWNLEHRGLSDHALKMRFIK